MASTGGTPGQGGRSRRARARDRSRLGARELLRSALVNDDDPRIPWWLPLPGLALALGWAAYQAATAVTAGEREAVEALWRALLWPGAAIFLLTTVATFFGWQLDID